MRRGSIEDRGRLVRFPPPKRSVYSDGWASFWRLGPGIITGVSDLDPSAVITATVTGAAFSYSLLWVVVLCIPFLLVLFEVTARIGIETGQGLLDIVREHYGRTMAMVAAGITIVINMAVIIADLMAVSDSFSIILGFPRMYFVAAIAFSVWYILIFRDYRKITRALVILSLPLYAYVASAFITAPPLRQLLWHTFVPRVTSGSHFVEGLVAVLGSLLTPYIVLWQTSSRTDPEHEPHKADAWLATIVSVVLFYSIMVSAASVLHFPSPVDMTTRQAAEALRPVVGDWGIFVFALGIIGAGMVALPVLAASMCYDVAQAMGWKYGLSEHPWEAKSFYLLITGSMFLAAIANFFRVNPVKALYWSMILAGILTIPTFLFILFISNDRRIVRTTNTWSQNFWIGAATGGSAAATLLYLWWSFAH